MRKLIATYSAVYYDGTDDYGWVDLSSGDMVPVSEAGSDPPQWAGIDIEPSSDDECSAVDLAVEFLLDHGIVEPSTYPIWMPGTWYTSADGVPDVDCEVRYSIHLEGFTEEEEAEIYERVARKCHQQ